jgi:hypothetical protein
MEQLFNVQGMKRSSARDLKNSSEVKKCCRNDDREVAFGKVLPFLTGIRKFFREKRILG